MRVYAYYATISSPSYKPFYIIVCSISPIGFLSFFLVFVFIINITALSSETIISLYFIISQMCLARAVFHSFSSWLYLYRSKMKSVLPTNLPSYCYSVWDIMAVWIGVCVCGFIYYILFIVHVYYVKHYNVIFPSKMQYIHVYSTKYARIVLGSVSFDMLKNYLSLIQFGFFHQYFFESKN